MLSPPFRLIAIVHDAARAIDAARWAAGAALPVGLMLRDPGHRPTVVRSLAEAVAAGLGAEPLAANVRPIANGVVVPGIRFVHLTSAQVEAGAVPPLVGAEAGLHQFGASVHDAHQAVRAAALGASYLIASPIFPTPSKPRHPGIGVQGLRAVIDAVRLPVFALGGISASNASAALDVGAAGVAAHSLWESPARDALESVAELLRAKFPAG